MQWRWLPQQNHAFTCTCSQHVNGTCKHMPGSVSSKFNLCAFTLIILRLAIRALQDKLSIYCQILKHSSQEQSAWFFQWIEVKVSKVSRPCMWQRAAVHRLFMQHVYLVYYNIANQTNIPVAVNILFTGQRSKFQMAWSGV